MAMFEIYAVDPQIKALPTVSTASGSIATFDTDMTENLVEVNCQIVAQQGGSGTPSPSNPRPITTYTEMNVTRCGANLLNPSLSVNGYYISATGVITPESNSCYIYIKVNVGETYTFSGRTYGTGNKRVHAYDENKNWIEQLGYQSMSGTGNYAVTVTIPSGCQYVGLSFAQADGNRLFTTGDEVLPYVAYNGTTETISFGQTVAQGLLNVTTGVLEITHGIDIYDGSSDENWNDLGGSNNGFYITNLSMNSGQFQSGMSNLFPTAFNNWDIANNSIRFGANNKNIMIYHVTDTISGITDVSTWKTWLANNNLQVVYLLPETAIQLDSVQIQALLNENNIWCDTNGDTSVKYILSVGKAIS